VFSVPVVDLRAPDAVAAVDDACRHSGFFSIIGHGVDPALRARLEGHARGFFALAEEDKAAIAMSRGGRAWRGWFPMGGELTSGEPDQKEGIYFGADLGPDHPLVMAGTPLHGPNLFPVRPAGLRVAVCEWMAAMTALGHRVVGLVAAALGDDEITRMTADPLVLFRIFHYPPARPGWGVGEHTDYGLLTILGQDGAGLEVRAADGWVAVPPEDDALVCNLGDMLERVSGGRYRSTPHRVRNAGGDGRLSYPFFFDPAWDAQVGDGTYGRYILGKVAWVFPDLGAAVLPTLDG
jgi:isopenicillin N synthase-like dioxygenase